MDARASTSKENDSERIKVELRTDESVDCDAEVEYYDMYEMCDDDDYDDVDDEEVGDEEDDDFEGGYMQDFASSNETTPVKKMDVVDEYKEQSNRFLDGSLTFREYEAVLEQEETVESNETDEKKIKERRVRRFLPPVLTGLMGQANLCYAKGDHDSALKMCLEIIRQVPTAPEPFQTLSELYEEKGMQEKSLQFAMIAAYLNPRDPEQWVNLGERSLQLNKLSEAITCYSKAVKCDPSNINAHIMKGQLLDRKGDRKAAIKTYHKLVEIMKPDCGAQVLQFAKLAARYYHEDGEVQKAKEVMDVAFGKVPHLVNSEDVNLYVELLVTLKEYIKALEIISKFCDVKIEAEEDIIADSETHQLSCSSFRVLTCEIPPDIPVQIRVKLTVTMIHLKSCHLLNTLLTPFLEDENVEQIGDLYIDVVEALMSEGMFVEALKLLKLLVDSQNYSQAAVWLNYAECLRSLGRPEEAISAYLMVMQQAPKHVEARLMVSELLNDLGRNDEAISVLTQDPESGSLDAGLLLERCLLLRENPDRSDEFLAVGRLLLSRHCVRIKSRDDLQPLSKLKGFARKQEALRKMNDEVADSVQEPSLVEGKTLLSVEEEWDLFRSLCRTAHDTRQFGLLQRLVFSALGSSVLNSSAARESEVFYMAIVACLHNKDSFHGYNLARDMVLAEGDTPPAWNMFNLIISFSDDTRHYKFIMRQLAKRPVHRPLSILHANICFISGTYKYALSEYMSAFKQGPDSLLAFMIAITMLQMACQKFTETKNSLVSQGVAFLWKYRDLRGELNVQEVHYNIGRFYHQLGVLPSATFHYKEALKLSGPMAEEHGDTFDLKREAAFNLSQIYLSSGATELARFYLERYFIV